MVNQGTWRPEKFTQGQLDDALQLLQQDGSWSEQKVAVFLVIFGRIFFRSATFYSDRELSSCRSCRASSCAPWVNFSGSQVLLMTLTPSVLWQL